MTGRDRIVVICCAVLAVLALGWIELVSPERKRAAKLSAQVATARAQLESAEGKLASARASESQYPAAYAAMVGLGKAVPASQEVPSLIYQLAQASGRRNVAFASIGAGSSGSGSSTSTSATAPAAASASTSTAASTSAASSSSSGAASSASSGGGLTQLPFTFTFEGSFSDLERLFRELTGFATRTSPGELQVSGRLLTIDSVRLSPVSSAGTAGRATPLLTGSVTATAYTAPASEGLSAGGGATPASAGASPAPASAASSSPTAPAIVKVNP